MSKPGKKHPISSLHKAMLDVLMQAPGRFLARLLKRKLAKAGAPNAAALSEALAEHLMSSSGEPFVWDDGREGTASVELQITDDEIEDVIFSVTSFLENDAPGLILRAVDDSAKIILKSLRRDWPEQKLHEHMQMEEFRFNLEERWGKAVDPLRMMLTIAREIGEGVAKRNRRSRARKNQLKRAVLMRLHARACQVVFEIITLIENGLADGAMARWRTLHEIAVVAALMAEHGDDLARRYLDHEAVEAKRAMDKYLACHEALGFESPTKAELAAVEDAYAKVLSIYGDRFGSPYGWAAHHLEHKRPTMLELELAAGRFEMRAHSQMASYNVHAGPRGLTFKHGLLGGSDVLLAGASNAGLDEPGQNAAYSLTQITSYLFDRAPRIDDAVQMKLLILLRDEATGAFGKAARRLVRDHAAEMKQKRVSARAD